MGKWENGAEIAKAKYADSIARLMGDGIAYAAGDAAKGREIASAAAESLILLEPLEWAANIKTKPGAVVYDPEKTRRYIYTGAAEMTHANPTYYPGAAGVYYWAIIPDTYNGIKVYPEIQGIVVAVLQNELWWDASKSKVFKYIGVSNPNCAYAPGSPGTTAIWGEVK